MTRSRKIPTALSLAVAVIVALGAGASPALAGEAHPVLHEFGRNATEAIGRSPYLQPVHIDGPESLIGTIAPVLITQGTRGSLTGRLAPEMAQDAMAIA